MFVKAKDAQRITINEEWTIINYSSIQDSPKFNVIVGLLNGEHPLTTNRASDRGYYILGGSGKVTVGSEVYDVSQGDFVLIPAGTAHGVSGQVEFLIITAPAFNPEDEK